MTVLGCLLLILSELKFPNVTVSSVDCLSLFIFHLEKIISFQAAPRRKRRALCASVKEEEGEGLPVTEEGAEWVGTGRGGTSLLSHCLDM